jgi:hypothetical protein
VAAWASLLGLVLAAAPAPPDDWYQTLWPLPTVELTTDARVFTLFAVLNACGLDQGTLERTQPTPRVRYLPGRRRVRERARALAPELTVALEAFLDAHPLPPEAYLAAALDPPRGGELAGLRPLLERAWGAWHLEELRAEAQPEEREALVAWVPEAQGPLQRALELLQAPRRPVRLLVNLFDAPGLVRGPGGPPEALVLVLGPAGADPGLDLARAAARAILAPLVARHIGGWTRGPMVLREARMDGATERTPAELATSLLSQVVAARALGGDEAGAASLEQARSLEGWVQATLPRLAWNPRGSP